MPKLLRLKQVAELLGVSRETLKGWVRAGKFAPARRLGAAWVWEETELQTYLANLPPAVAPPA
jgi:excisionase family DNA binding protein